MNKIIHITKSFDMVDFTYQCVRIQDDIVEGIYNDETLTLEFDTDLIHDKILEVIALDIENYKRKLCDTSTKVIAEFSEPSPYYISNHKNFRGFSLVIYNSNGIIHSIYEFRFKNLIRKINGIDFYRDDTTYECFMKNLIYGYNRVSKYIISTDASFIDPTIKDDSFSYKQKIKELGIYNTTSSYIKIPNSFSSIKRNKYLCMDQGFVTYIFKHYKK